MVKIGQGLLLVFLLGGAACEPLKAAGRQVAVERVPPPTRERQVAYKSCVQAQGACNKCVDARPIIGDAQTFCEWHANGESGTCVPSTQGAVANLSAGIAIGAEDCKALARLRAKEQP